MTTATTCTICEEARPIARVIDEGGSVPPTSVCAECLGRSDLQERLAVIEHEGHEVAYSEVITDDSGTIIDERTQCECGAILKDWRVTR